MSNINVPKSLLELFTLQLTQNFVPEKIQNSHIHLKQTPIKTEAYIAMLNGKITSCTIINNRRQRLQTLVPRLSLEVKESLALVENSARFEQMFLDKGILQLSK